MCFHFCNSQQSRFGRGEKGLERTPAGSLVNKPRLSTRLTRPPSLTSTYLTGKVQVLSTPRVTCLNSARCPKMKKNLRRAPLKKTSEATFFYILSPVALPTVFLRAHPSVSQSSGNFPSIIKKLHLLFIDTKKSDRKSIFTNKCGGIYSPKAGGNLLLCTQWKRPWGPKVTLLTGSQLRCSLANLGP